jgi:hypothetical protein
LKKVKAYLVFLSLLAFSLKAQEWQLQVVSKKGSAISRLNYKKKIPEQRSGF